MSASSHTRSSRGASALAVGAVVALAALTGCPAQPVTDVPCDYDPVAGNCFDADRDFVFDDDRVDAMDVGSLPRVDGACRDPARGFVSRVVDGDTMDVVLDGATSVERIRFIGVDTPETYVSYGYPHCYGADAKLFTEQLTSRRIVLTFDRGCEDRNGRTLAYVWLGPGQGDLWQRQLMRRGYARVLTVAPNDHFESTFIGDEAIARATDEGQWGACRVVSPVSP